MKKAIEGIVIKFSLTVNEDFKSLKKYYNLLKFLDYNDCDRITARADQKARTARKNLAAGVFDDMD